MASSSTPQQPKKKKNRLSCSGILLPPPKQVGGDNGDAATGDTAATGGGAADGALLYRDRQPAWQCSFSRDGNWLAAAYGSPDPCVRVWAKTSDGRTAAIATATIQEEEDGGGKDEDADQRCDNSHEWTLHSTLMGIHVRTVRSVAFAPTTKPLVLASASFDGSISVYELVQPNSSNSNAAAKNASGAGGGTSSSSSWWDCLAQLEGHDNEVKCVTWNATGSLLASCGRDKTVWIWECFLPGTVGGSGGGGGGGGGDGDFECLAVLNGHGGDVKCVRFAPSHGLIGDGDEILVSASYDNTVRIWAEDAGDWYLAASLDASSSSPSTTIWSLAVSPGGDRLISGSADGCLTVYEFQKSDESNADDDAGGNKKKKHEPGYKCVGKLEGAHGSSAVYSVSIASARCGHGRIASGGADNRIQIYREAPQQQNGSEGGGDCGCGAAASDPDAADHHHHHGPLFELDASVVATPNGDVNCVCWHPFDGSVLASAGDDGAVRLWRYDTS